MFAASTARQVVINKRIHEQTLSINCLRSTAFRKSKGKGKGKGKGKKGATLMEEAQTTALSQAWSVHRKTNALVVS